MEESKEKFSIGVIVGRFQIHDLHDEHKKLIDYVLSKHDKVILFLGCTPALGTKRNPLDFVCRKKMVEEHYEDLSAILPLYDQRSNEIWSQVLDSKIREIFQIGSVVLYGSKDSFIPYYTGSFHTCELVPDNFVSATDVRAEVSNKILKSKEFRAGIIYGTYNSHPNVYPTVDVAITNEDQTKVLLGRKKNEVEFRFIGGFVDPDDESLKATVRRESSEETNLEVGNITYLESFKVKDWRYENEIDKSIMTHFFIAKKIFGTEKAGDDIVEVKWFDIDKIKDSDLVGEHIKLYHELTNYLTRYEK